MRKKRIALLGSTGSIGTQALSVIRRHPERFEATVLTAGSNADLLIAQAIEFGPDAVVIADESRYAQVKDALSDRPIKVYAGAEALCQVVESQQVDMVLAAMVGFAGLKPTLCALRAGKAVALANKETLVVAGELVTACAMEHRVPLLPVDSEHSAIFQCLQGEVGNPVEKLLLTASGGPFRKFTAAQLADVTPAQALCHPQWSMGAKITIDSASMLNKGFEMIEARWLFGLPVERIEVVVHPESIVHSAVAFADGAVKAQLGVPDMCLPIQYAFAYPQRLADGAAPLDLFALGALHFERPNEHLFPCLTLAREASQRGGNAPCVLNAAGEVTNQAFRDGRIRFVDMPDLMARTMAKVPFEATPSLDTYFDTDAEARAVCESMIG